MYSSKSSLQKKNSFNYYLNNKNDVIEKLKIRIIELRCKKYVCSDSEISIIDNEIENLEKAIKFNESLNL